MQALVGPSSGNGRSTSGDETRGVRSSYGDRPGALGELWMLWAREAMTRWIAFDDEWGREMRLNLFHVTGDLILRDDWDNFQLRCKLWWDRARVTGARHRAMKRAACAPPTEIVLVRSASCGCCGRARR